MGIIIFPFKHTTTHTSTHSLTISSKNHHHNFSVPVVVLFYIFFSIAFLLHLILISCARFHLCCRLVAVWRVSNEHFVTVIISVGWCITFKINQMAMKYLAPTNDKVWLTAFGEHFLHTQSFNQCVIKIEHFWMFRCHVLLVSSFFSLCSVSGHKRNPIKQTTQ